MLSDAGIKLAIALAALFWGISCHAQRQDSLSVEEQRLLEADTRSLLNANVNLNTYYATTRTADLERRDEREAPAMVQIVTARQLKAYGVRTLQEALMLVPGFSAAMGRDNLIGTGINGNWAMEGRCLYLLNGMPLNENSNGSFAFSNQFPMANVERIEAILSPGTVLHGGYSALGVVNVITRSAESGAGSSFQLHSGISNGGQTFTTASISGAQRLSSQQDISYLAWHSSGSRSNARFNQQGGAPVNLSDSTAFNNNAFQLTYRWKSLKASTSFSEEQFKEGTDGGSMMMRNMIFGLEQRLPLVKAIELDWHAAYTDQTPWNHINTIEPSKLAANTTDQRTSAQATLIYKPIDGVVIRFGSQGYRESNTYTWRGATGQLHLNGAPSISFHSLAWYAEAGWHSRFGDLMAGYREEQHSLTGSWSASRLAYTRVFGRFHAKLLWGRAFTIPTVLALERMPQPSDHNQQDLDNTEAEVGMRIGNSIRVTASMYRISPTVPAPIAMDSLSLSPPTPYTNPGTQGVNARIQGETKRISLLAGLAAYQTLQGHHSTADAGPSRTNRFNPGLPGMRVTAALGYDAAPWITLSCRAQWQTGLSSWTVTEDGGIAPEVLQDQVNLFAGLNLRPGKEHRLSIELACANLLDTPLVLTTADGLGALHYQLNSREWRFGLTYRFAQ